MEIKNIIFDFGGVLVDWNPRYMYRDIFTNEQEMESFLANICTDEWNLQQDKGRTLKEGTSFLQKEHPDYQDLIRLYYDNWEIMLKGDIPENVEILKQLKEKDRYKLYGLTNWSSETFPIALKRFSFFQLFDGIVVSGDEKMVKPEKEIFHLLLDRFHLKAETSLFIDDNASNIKSAKEMGFHAIHFGPSVNLKQALSALGVD